MIHSAMMHTTSPRNPRPIPARRRWALAACLGAVVATSGCYNGETLVERVRSRAIRTRLEEIDLGSYRITLPKDTQKNEMVEVTVDLYAHASRHRLKGLKKELEAKSYLLRDDLLATFRSFTQEDLDDPGLNRLRNDVLEAVNSVLDEPQLSALGVSDFQISRH